MTTKKDESNGINPLIVALLLVAFTMVIAGVLASWAVNFVHSKPHWEQYTVCEEYENETYIEYSANCCEMIRYIKYDLALSRDGIMDRIVNITTEEECEMRYKSKFGMFEDICENYEYIKGKIMLEEKTRPTDKCLDRDVRQRWVE